MRKKLLIAIVLLVAVVLFVVLLPLVCDVLGLRIWLIKATIRYDLPMWLQMWLWGW